jgi:hypothetical protein
MNIAYTKPNQTPTMIHKKCNTNIQFKLTNINFSQIKARNALLKHLNKTLHKKYPKIGKQNSNLSIHQLPFNPSRRL